jgi:hypothetical protein
MIHSTSSSDRTLRPEGAVPSSPKAAPRRPDGDQFTARQAEALRAALAAQPEIRPEALARGRALAADPAWPPADVLRGVAAVILRAPDPSADAG